jgi:MoaA/NifB/PqqE/SkfB family radical SAM enzyme
MYEQVVKTFSKEYTIHHVRSELDLYQQLVDIRKDVFDENERVFIDVPDIDLLGAVQNQLNNVDISNSFVMVVSEDLGLKDRIKQVSEENILDPISVTGILINNNEVTVIDPITIIKKEVDKVKVLNLPNESFCVLPWVALEIQPNGSHAVCCLAEDMIRDEKGNELTVTKNTLDEVLDAHSMKQLRKDFLAGKKPKTCDKCWREEDSGRVSKRLNTLDRLKHLGIANETWTENRKELLMYDLKVGNICNLKCRICGSYSSSQIATEELPKQDKKNSFAYKTIELGRWPREQPHFWDRLHKLSNEIRYLEFTGGEPFLIQEHFDFLEKLIGLGVAGNVEIHYNTNGTKFPDAKHIWKHFKLVEIAFSIDDVEERFEYQRSNAKWSEVNANIQKFKELKQELGNIHLQVCSTINVFNVMYLEGLAHWIDEQQFDTVYWNMLHDEEAVSIRALPTIAKIRAEEILRTANVSNQHKKQFENCIRFMEQGSSLDGTELLRKVKDKDQKRNENLWDHHPELAEAIGYET